MEPLVLLGGMIARRGIVYGVMIQLVSMFVP